MQRAVLVQRAVCTAEEVAGALGISKPCACKLAREMNEELKQKDFLTIPGQVEQQEHRLKEPAPAVRNMEQLAAQFSDDPERILPEPGPPEGAKSYREKSQAPAGQDRQGAALPVPGLCRVEREVSAFAYSRVREGNANLSERLQEMKMEPKALRGTVADFERVKRAFGPEEVERDVEDAKRRTAEKEQRTAKRKFSREAR